MITLSIPNSGGEWRPNMSGNYNFNFSSNGSSSSSATSQPQSVIYDSRRNNYTSPQENFIYTDPVKKPSVDICHEVDEVMKEGILKVSQDLVKSLSSQSHGGEHQK